MFVHQYCMDIQGLADCNPAVSKSQRGNCTSRLTASRTTPPSGARQQLRPVSVR